MQMTKKFFIVFGLVIIAAVIIAFFSLKNIHSKNDLHKGMLQVEATPLHSNAGWGYEIVVGQKVFIHQQFIPAIQGEKAFATKEDAMKTAGLVVSKIVKGKVPSITMSDLSSLGIDY